MKLEILFIGLLFFISLGIAQPVANIQTEQINEETFELDGTNSEGEIVSYQWYLDGQEISSSSTTTVNIPQINEKEYNVTLEVTNLDNETDSETVILGGFNWIIIPIVVVILLVSGILVKYRKIVKSVLF